MANSLDRARYDEGNLRNPAFDAFAVTPSDSTDLPNGVCKGVYVGVTGDVQVTTEAQAGNSGPPAVVFKGATAGSVIPVRCSRVWSTNTNATNLVALY